MQRQPSNDLVLPRERISIDFDPEEADLAAEVTDPKRRLGKKRRYSSVVFPKEVKGKLTFRDLFRLPYYLYRAVKIFFGASREALPVSAIAGCLVGVVASSMLGNYLNATHDTLGA